MPLIWLLSAILLFSAAGYVVGRQRAMQSADGDARILHSLPSYYGANVMLFAAVPALLVLAAWLVVQPFLIDSRVSGMIPERLIPEGGSLSLAKGFMPPITNCTTSIER